MGPAALALRSRFRPAILCLYERGVLAAAMQFSKEDIQAMITQTSEATSNNIVSKLRTEMVAIGEVANRAEKKADMALAEIASIKLELPGSSDGGSSISPSADKWYPTYAQLKLGDWDGDGLTEVAAGDLAHKTVDGLSDRHKASVPKDDIEFCHKRSSEKVYASRFHIHEGTYKLTKEIAAKIGIAARRSNKEYKVSVEMNPADGERSKPLFKLKSLVEAEYFRKKRAKKRMRLDFGTSSVMDGDVLMASLDPYGAVENYEKLVELTGWKPDDVAIKYATFQGLSTCIKGSLCESKSETPRTKDTNKDKDKGKHHIEHEQHRQIHKYDNTCKHDKHANNNMKNSDNGHSKLVASAYCAKTKKASAEI